MVFGRSSVKEPPSAEHTVAKRATPIGVRKRNTDRNVYHSVSLALHDIYAIMTSPVFYS